MVSLKVLLVLALIAAVACEPCHIRSKLRPRHKRHKHAGLAIRGLRDGLGFLFRGLRGHCHFRKGLYNALIDIRPPNSLDDVISDMLIWGLGVSNAIDIWIPGLGGLVSRMIAVAIRLIVCVLDILGSNRSFCRKNYYERFLDISIGSNISIDILFKKFRCNSARDELDAFIDKASHGKGRADHVPGGISYFKGSRRIVIENIYRILVIMDKRRKLSKKDLTSLCDCIITLTLSISNSYSKDLGNSLSTEAINSYDKYLVDNGCPSLKDNKQEIEVTISKANDDSDEDDSPWGDLSYDGDENSGDSPDDSPKENPTPKNNDDSNDDNGGKNKNDDDDNKNKNDDKNKGKNDNDNGKGENDNSGGNNNEITATPKTPLSKKLAIVCRPITSGKSRIRIPSEVINDLLGLDKISSFIDAAKFISNLSILLGFIVDTLVKGLGVILGKMCLFIPRVIFCLNSRDQAYCSRNFVKVYGINVDSDDLDGLREQFGLKNAEKQVIRIMEKATHGKGIKAVAKGGQKHVMASILKLARICDAIKPNAPDSWGKMYVVVATMTGVIFNSFDTKKHTLGTEFTKDLSSSCDRYIEQKGYQTITENESEIKQNTQNIGNDTSFFVVVNTRTEVTVTTVETTEEEDQNES